MKKCKVCGEKKENLYQHHDGSYVCEKCMGNFFTCPDCGKLFDQDDYENGDSGTGFCVKCAINH